MNTTQPVPASTPPNRQQLLDEWLDLHNARSCWSKTISDDTSVECYRVGPSLVLVLRYARGWDIFTSANKIMIPSTLRDAELRTGLADTAMPESFEAWADKGLAKVRRINTDRSYAELTAEEAEGFAYRLLTVADRVREPKGET